jgi:hypothetical protein
MQIVENWSDVDGEVTELLHNPSDPSFAIAKVRVDASAPVGSFPNLLTKNVGTEIAVRVPSATIQRIGLAPGHRVQMRIRQAGVDKYFSHPEAIEKK